MVADDPPVFSLTKLVLKEASGRPLAKNCARQAGEYAQSLSHSSTINSNMPSINIIPRSAPPLFSYSRLQFPNSLRLVKLKVGSLDSNDVDVELVEIPPDHLEPHSHQVPHGKQEGHRVLDMPKQHEPYEAVSWCWGTQQWDTPIRVHQGERVFTYLISPNLHSALKAFRYEDRVRTLWIDAISIDQKNSNEKNHQVPMMTHIYGSAQSVLIWLGDGDEKSKLALNFIKNDVLKLWDFDKLCDDKSTAKKWDALISLMKKPWFSRRWVVQEIVLANQATLQVGMETITWQEFADAVSLFVEVETATHRLSEVMKTDPAFYHIPDFFGDVRRLGATLLVEATSNVYRRSKDGKREFLLSLEYLVSSLSVFDATEPRDTVFALLAISRDTQPQAAVDHESRKPETPKSHQHITSLAQSRFAVQSYSVDYKRPFIEICKDFVYFSIRKSDRATALDILCRPWAPQIKAAKDEPVDKLPSWIPDLEGAAFAMHEHTTAGQRMHRKNADPLVGLPSSGQRVYQAAGSRTVDLTALKFKKRKTFYSMFVKGFVLDEVGALGEICRNGGIPHQWLGPAGWGNTKTEPPPDEFWRTLVADRGSYGRNAPTFYTRACEECFKRIIPGNSLNTKELIDEGRCTIVAEFLRRVQAVVWNRILLRTRGGRLALVHETAKEGDLICILYGCSVPVVLRKIEKTLKQIIAEEAEDEKVLHKAQKDAVDKIQAAYLERRDRIRKRKLLQRKSRKETAVKTGKQAWEVIRHGVVIAFAIYAWLHANLWELVYRDSFVRIGFIVCVVLFEGFPWILEAIAERAWLRVRGGWGKLTEKKMKVVVAVQGPENAYYELVGPCYVHGMMNGEAITLQNEKSLKAQIFELR
jgi:hypothetical protein